MTRKTGYALLVAVTVVAVSIAVWLSFRPKPHLRKLETFAKTVVDQDLDKDARLAAIRGIVRDPEFNEDNVAAWAWILANTDLEDYRQVVRGGGVCSGMVRKINENPELMTAYRKHIVPVLKKALQERSLLAELALIIPRMAMGHLHTPELFPEVWEIANEKIENPTREEALLQMNAVCALPYVWPGAEGELLDHFEKMIESDDQGQQFRAVMALADMNESERAWDLVKKAFRTTSHWQVKSLCATEFSVDATDSTMVPEVWALIDGESDDWPLSDKACLLSNYVEYFGKRLWPFPETEADYQKALEYVRKHFPPEALKNDGGDYSSGCWDRTSK